MGIKSNLAKFGVSDPILLDGNPEPRHVDYLDLFGLSEVAVSAVVEYQNSPLLYVVDDSCLSGSSDSKIGGLKKLLANRGGRSFLAVLKPGQIEVHKVDFETNMGKPIVKLAQESDAQFFFQDFALGVCDDGIAKDVDVVYSHIFRLLKKTSDALIEEHKLEPDEVLSLVGRALFLRFLVDRKIVNDIDLYDVCPDATDFKECFLNASNAAATARWLDDTFNGDLLPLPVSKGGYQGYFKDVGSRTNQDVFFHLSAINLKAEPAQGNSYQLMLDWKQFDFSHIPVGVLSQIYESFSGKWDPLSKSTSVHYTPKHIAQFMVEEAFKGLRHSHSAKVLDPSCGAGIFLVLAFKKIYAEKWTDNKVRPGTAEIREILYKQICGFDISESALRLAALSLYLVSLELDVDPRPLESLAFEPLRDRVLFDMRQETEKGVKGPVIGSIGSYLGDRHEGKFDLVIGNPPWTKVSDKEISEQFTQEIRKVAGKRGLIDIAEKYENPDGNLDIPFVWKSMDWAKKGGVISLALPSRFLFKQTSKGREARNALFSALKVTGVLNASGEMRFTKVWPNISHPFFLLFAQNKIPAERSGFWFINPVCEKTSNSRGIFRIDHVAAEPVENHMVINQPHLLKTLSVGSGLEHAVLEKIKRAGEFSVEKYRDSLGCPRSKNGYKEGGEKQRNQKEKRVKESGRLKGLSLLDAIAGEKVSYYVDAEKLNDFDGHALARPRTPDDYKAPILLLRQTIKKEAQTDRALMSLDDVMYSESYYGYSGYGHKDGELLTRYLFLIANSDLFLFYALLSSSKFAVERPVIQKADFDNFPIISLEKLGTGDCQRIFELSEAFSVHPEEAFKKVNQWLCKVYGLDRYDRRVVKDALEVSLPFSDSKSKAQATPILSEKRRFSELVKKYLQPYFDATEETIAVTVFPSENKHAWTFLGIASQSLSVGAEDLPLKKLVKLANKQGASRIIMSADGVLYVGLLNQYRYWTPTRARYCALEIIEKHLDDFPVSGGAHA